VHQSELDLAEALTTQVRRQVGGPELPRLDLGLELANDAPEGRFVGVEHLERPDLLADETAHPPELLFELGVRREVPGHGLTLISA
jgi:hypothetical protein